MVIKKKSNGVGWRINATAWNLAGVDSGQNNGGKGDFENSHNVYVFLMKINFVTIYCGFVRRSPRRHPSSDPPPVSLESRRIRYPGHGPLNLSTGKWMAGGFFLPGRLFVRQTERPRAVCRTGDSKRQTHWRWPIHMASPQTIQPSGYVLSRNNTASFECFFFFKNNIDTFV